MHAVQFNTNIFATDILDADEFFGLVKFSTTGPMNFDYFKGIVTASDEWKFMDGPVVIEDFESYADYDSMTAVLNGVSLSLLAMPTEPLCLPAFAGSLEKAYSEGVDIQDTTGETNDSDAFGYVLDEDHLLEGREVNVVSSKIVGKNRHKILLDLDFDAALIPTSTPGHFHLYIDKTLTPTEYEEFLNVCLSIGLIAGGNMNQWNNHQKQYLRLPHVRKGGPKPKATGGISPHRTGSLIHETMPASPVTTLHLVGLPTETHDLT